MSAAACCRGGCGTAGEGVGVVVEEGGTGVEDPEDPEEAGGGNRGRSRASLFQYTLISDTNRMKAPLPNGASAPLCGGPTDPVPDRVQPRPDCCVVPVRLLFPPFDERGRDSCIGVGVVRRVGQAEGRDFLLDGVALVVLTLCRCSFRFPESADRLRKGWVGQLTASLSTGRKTRLVYEVVEQRRVDGRRQVRVGVRLQLRRDERRGRARCRIPGRGDQVLQRSIQRHPPLCRWGRKRSDQRGAAPLSTTHSTRLARMEQQPDKVLMEGFMLKKKRKALQGYARRYFRLSESGPSSLLFPRGVNRTQD